MSSLNTPSPGDTWWSKHTGYVIVQEVSNGTIKVRFPDSNSWTLTNKKFLKYFKLHKTSKTDGNTTKLKQE